MSVCEVPLSVPQTHHLIHVPTQDTHADSIFTVFLPMKGSLAVHVEVASLLWHYLKSTLLQDTFMSQEKESNGFFKRTLKIKSSLTF